MSSKYVTRKRKMSFKRGRGRAKRYAGFRSGLRRSVDWQVGRDARRFELNSVGSFDIASNAFVTFIVQTVATQNFVFAPRLFDFSSFADIAATYDAYRVLSISIKLIAQYDPKVDIQATAGIQNFEFIKSVIDINDASTLTTTLPDQVPSCVYTRVGADVKRSWMPAVLLTTGTGTNMVNDSKSQWISMANAGGTVPQLSCKVQMPSYTLVAGFVRYLLNVRMTVIARSQG